MSNIEAQTSLSSTFGLIFNALGYAFKALYWATLWIVLRVVGNLPKYVYKTVSTIATPLTYPLFYLWRAIVFLLSPAWALWKMALGLGSWSVGLIVKLKFLYIYFSIAAMIGIFSACMLYGTSNIIFSLLRISSSSQPSRHRHWGKQQQRHSKIASRRQLLKGDEDVVEESLSSVSDTDDWSPTLEQPRRQLTNRQFEQAYRQANSTRISPIKPSRRFRGLLAQTIHEESSESD